MIKGFISFFCIILTFFFVMSCSSDSSDDKTTANGNAPEFYDNMKDTTPVYIPSSVSSKALPTGGTWDNTAGILYSVFFTLRDFNPATDEGHVDRSNFYKLLYDVENVFQGSYSGAVELSAAQEIDSPFAGINTSGTLFTHAANLEDDSLSIAYVQADDVTKALITWKWTEASYPGKAERGIAYFTFDEVSKDISVDMVFWVDYPDQSDYSLRCVASGNVDDHSFQFNYIIGNNKILAKGVSQGTGNYVIFKFNENDPDGPYYLRVPADEDESFFSDIYNSENIGVETVYTNITDSQDYMTWINGQAFMVTDDLLDSTAELNIGNPEEGTINLDFTE